MQTVLREVILIGNGVFRVGVLLAHAYEGGDLGQAGGLRCVRAQHHAQDGRIDHGNGVR